MKKKKWKAKMSKQFFFIGANIMFWQGGFNSRQVNFYVKVGNSFAPHINAPGGYGAAMVGSISYSLFSVDSKRDQYAVVLECSILPLHNLPVYIHACLSNICIKSAWKIEWNALLCVCAMCILYKSIHIGNIFFLLHARSENHSNSFWSVNLLYFSATPTHIISISALKMNKKSTHHYIYKTCAHTQSCTQ